MKKAINNLLWPTTILFALILPVSPFISTRILVLLFVLSVFFGNKKIVFTDYLKSSWDILIYLIIVGIGILYSSDKSEGVKTLETSFSLLALSIIFLKFPDFNREKLNKIFLFFSLGIIGAGLICIINAGITYLFDGHQTEVFFFYNFTSIINSHPTYLAYYLIFAITFGLYALNYEKVEFPTWSFSYFILFCFLILLLTGGQTAFVSILFVFAFFILKYLLGQKSGNQKLTFTLVAIMLLSILLVNSGVQVKRVQVLNDSWDRFELWRSGIFANPDWLLGVGTGDYKTVLNEYFIENNNELFAEENLNAHNQFIQIFFSNGFLGLIAILIIIVRPLYLAFKNNDQMGILMIFPFLIYGMTEVFLGRYQGVVFFALLHQALVSYYLSIRPNMQP